MDTKAILAAHRHDVRLDLFRGLANWFIFLSRQSHFSLTFIAVTVMIWPAMRFGISAASIAALASSAVAA